ncbi:protein NPAT isoform X1 [Synchiropus splendidus]|uniref:protein NPAT isoform X1 n=1 Tax=Synchiropus splendidus TaxID=270530 RepID=UPI00237D353E|nr:protein NPAT isoform X1 [Synchiropus splendidus]
MLLPSDVARLVLGYLQEEGLAATSRTFINESPNLKEYAEYTVEDGVIPACVFSVFGKGLTTILNEYMATKTKESSHEVPAMMTSLWKKLDFTLKQIKSLQTSPATSGCQRVRSRVGVANLVRQRALTVTSASTVVCSSLSETSTITCPAQSSHCIISHSTPVSYSGPDMRAVSGTPGSSRLLMPRDSPLQITVSESRLNPGPMSPGRRKWDTPRKRNVATGDGTEAPQPEEAVDENFPQLVIQNARDKILRDRSLQEKLAENINKILANEPVPQTSRSQSTAIEADQSIDEILGLQGEIHMSDDAIHDILEQTESDPAFQALFDLFEYNKTKPSDAEPTNEMTNEDLSTDPAQTEPPGPSSADEQVQNNDQGAMQVASVAPLLTGMSRVAQPRKNRKTTLLRKTLLDTSGRSSRIEKSSAKLLINPGPPRSVPSAAVSSLRSELTQGTADNVGQMEVDEPAVPYSPSECMNSLAPQENDNLPPSAVLRESFVIPSTTVTNASGTQSSANFGVDGVQQSGDKCGTNLNNRPAFFHPAAVEPKSSSVLASSSEGQKQPSARTDAPLPSTSSAAAAISLTSTSSTAAKCASSTSATPSLVTPMASGDQVTENQSSSSKDSADPSNIVSLKIIISDNNEQDSSSDAAASQAVSSISTDKIPTIYLSSPTKSPRCSSRPNLDEAALAVNGLQNSEVQGNCAGGATGSVVTSTSPQTQQNYIIQLPVDASNTPVQGATASYFLVTEPAGANGETRQILVPAGVTNGPSLPAIGQFGVNPPPPLSQGFTPGSTFILPSPGKPVMLPMSVMGQNAVQMVPNQIVAIPSQVPLPQADKSKASTVKQSLAAGAAKRTKGKGAPGVSSKQKGQQKDSSPSHRRILCFDASAGVEPQTSSIAPTNATDKSPVKPTEEVHTRPQVKPNILSGNKPKRRVETVRCTADSQVGEGFGRMAEKSSSLQQAPEKDLKKNSRKQEHGTRKHKFQTKSADEVNASHSVKTSAKPSASKDRSHSEDKMSEDTAAQDSHTLSFSEDSAAKPGGRKDKDESKETGDKGPAKSRDSRSDKRMQDFPNVTANKENEVKGSTQDQQQATTSNPPAISPSLASSAKVPSKTSSLAKQAAEMLQDIQGLNSPVKPGRRPAASASDLAAPRTPGTTCNQEDNISSPRTPSRTRRGKDTEGTPKHVLLPNTPDVPGCSPASEAGSENSINMAAHTLMILSRAAIARTGSPLKDSLRQEGVGEKSPASSKTSKKRKQSSPAASPPAKKETKKSPVKKKEREKKKIVDCFPLDLDVDKFLSSLHYDE